MAAVPKRRTSPEAHEARWLNPAQLDAWMMLMLVLMRLPTALDQQLRADAEVSFVEYYVLAGLSEQPKHTMRMSSLSVLANAELSRLSHLMSRLEKRGLVRREPDPTDGRYTNAILTPAGLRHVTAAAPGHVARVRSLVIDALSDNELQTLQCMLQKIAARIDVAAQDGSGRHSAS